LKVEAYPPPHDDARVQGPRSVRCDPTARVPPDATPPPQTRARMRRMPRICSTWRGSTSRRAPSRPPHPRHYSTSGAPRRDAAHVGGGVRGPHLLRFRSTFDVTASFGDEITETGTMRK